MIYDETLKLAGSIDMVYEDPISGELSIFDWKRAKEISKINSFGKCASTECISHLPDTNFWHYSLQLNTYKAILESKYGKKVKELYLVKLHPDNPRKTFDLIQCADLTNEVYDLFEIRRKQIANI
jgi:ATP-dependent exoDNAse (exonuclease V) beta subunit